MGPIHLTQYLDNYHVSSRCCATGVRFMRACKRLIENPSWCFSVILYAPTAYSHPLPRAVFPRTTSAEPFGCWCPGQTKAHAFIMSDIIYYTPRATRRARINRSIPCCLNARIPTVYVLPTRRCPKGNKCMHPSLLTWSHLKRVASARNTLTSSVIESVGRCRTPEQSNMVSSRAEAKIDGDSGEHTPATRATAAVQV